MTTKVPYSSSPDVGGTVFQSVRLTVGLSPATLGRFRTRPIEAIVDSGASRCLFDADFALAMGLDLERGIPQIAEGIGGRVTMWLHPVTLHVPGGPLRVLAGFQRDLPFAGLLGMNGFFEHFTVTFDGALKECSLERIYRA